MIYSIWWNNCFVWLSKYLRAIYRNVNQYNLKVTIFNGKSPIQWKLANHTLTHRDLTTTDKLQRERNTSNGKNRRNSYKWYEMVTAMHIDRNQSRSNLIVFCCIDLFLLLFYFHFLLLLLLSCSFLFYLR